MMTITKPGWVDGFRQRAWERFEKAEPPLKTAETWRRMPFDSWGLGALRAEDTYAMTAGVSPLEEAGAELGDLIAPGAVSGDFQKLAAANAALWRGGAYVRVPRGKRVEEPVRLTFRYDASRPYSFPRAAVVVEDGAEVTIVEEHVGGAGVSAAFSNLVVGRGAKVRYFYTQETGPEAVHFWHQHARLEQDAELSHASVLIGGKRHKSELEIELAGRGARSDLNGVLFARGSQFFDPHTNQLHRASNTSSDLNFRAALRDQARSIYTGLIRIEQDALDCEAFQQNRNLLLSDQARADSTPVLEILPDRVRCKHGATAGPIRPEELYYLQARGISPEEATQMLVMGFFEPVLGSIPLEDLRERLRDTVGREVRR